MKLTSTVNEVEVMNFVSKTLMGNPQNNGAQVKGRDGSAPTIKVLPRQ